MNTSIRAVLALALALLALPALAQTNLRIGLGDDGDALDPTTSRFYTTRIVFAAICDKLFDIDEKANIVPQLALSHETSADGKTVTLKLRPGVKFHDGEPFDAKAAKYSLDRHLIDEGLVPPVRDQRRGNRSRWSIRSPSSSISRRPSRRCWPSSPTAPA